jgi:3-oxoadipate enol-lactonase
MQARVNDIDLYYEIHGEGDPVLLIPGLGSDSATWSPLLSDFSRTYRLIMVENRGSGRSSKPAGDYSTAGMADDCAALLDHLQVPQAHVIGKSMGGMIAQMLAARHPNRVRSLVLVSTLMRHDRYGEELLELGREIAEKAGLFTTYRQAFVLSYSRKYCMTNRSRLVEVKSLMDQMDEREMLRGYVAQSFACQRHDATAEAPGIVAPALVITGGEDIITTPDHARRLAAAIPNCELLIMPRGGHGLWREFPEDVNPVVLDFLRRH